MNYDLLLALHVAGMGTEGLGPEAEWHPVPHAQHQVRHADYWHALGDLLSEAYGDDPDADDSDLPWWMSQKVSERLKNNG